MELLVIAGLMGALLVGIFYGIKAIEKTLYLIALGCSVGVFGLLVDIGNGFALTFSSWGMAAMILVMSAAAIFASGLGWVVMMASALDDIFVSTRRLQPAPITRRGTPQSARSPPIFREPPKNLMPDAELEDRYLDELTRKSRRNPPIDDPSWRTKYR